MGSPVTVHNLASGAEMTFCGPAPLSALVHAYALDIGDKNTWEHQSKYGHLRLVSRSARTACCGDWSVVLEKEKPMPRDLTQLDLARVEELLQILQQADVDYWTLHAPQLLDIQYDALKRELAALVPNHPYLQRIEPGMEAVASGDMLSLEKAYEPEEVLRWLQTLNHRYAVASPKLDGVALQLNYDETGQFVQAWTRKGEDVTEAARRMEGVPLQLPIAGYVDPVQQQPVGALAVRGEAVMERQVFQERFAHQAANPRNCAAGLLRRQDDPSEARFVRFVAYDLVGVSCVEETQKHWYLVQWGFVNACSIAQIENPLVWDADGVRFWLESCTTNRDLLPVDTDGVVFKAQAIADQERLGSTAHHPRYAIAWKFQAQKAESTVVGCEWQVARTGTLTPVLLIQPVSVAGVVVRRATLHHLERFWSLQPHLGDRLIVARRGDAIPHVEQILGAQVGQRRGAPLLPPALCPACSSSLLVVGAYLQCSQPQNCIPAIVGRILHWCRTLDLDGWGDKLIEQLVSVGMARTPLDIYQLTEAQLATLERVGFLSARKLVATRDSRRRIPFATLLAAVGLDGIGPTVAARAAAHYTSFEVFCSRARAGQLDPTEIEGIGPELAASLLAGAAWFTHPDGPNFAAAGLIIDEEAPTTVGTGKLAGQRICFTGTPAGMSKSSAARLVQAHGATVVPSVTKDTTLVVVGSEGSTGMQSTKAQKAQKYGIRLVWDHELWKELQS